MKYTLIVFFILNLLTEGYGQVSCGNFTITGTTTSPYINSNSQSCMMSPAPTGSLIWTSSSSTGFIKHTFTIPQTNVTLFYTVVNTDDIGTISINGGGTLSMTVVNGCFSVSGNIIGPYTGAGSYGDIEVNITSTQPFTEITLVNTAGKSGFVSGDCKSVVSNNNPPCVLNLGNDTTLCQGDILTLDATTLNATYLWQDNSIKSTYNVTQQGTYWVKVTTNNCTVTDTINANYTPTPFVNLGNDTNLCEGQTLTLDATTLNATYLWQDNSIKSTYNVNETGLYWTETKNNTCLYRDSINVVIHPDLLELGNDTILCDPNFTYTLSSNVSGSAFLWNTGETTQSISTTNTGLYWVVVIDQNNCTLKDSVTLKQKFHPINLGENQLLCAGEVLKLDVANPAFKAYEWSTGEFTSSIIADIQGQYWVKAIDTNQCLSYDTVQVDISGCVLFIPNAFSPDGDNVNDVFNVVTDDAEAYELTIFDRWGEMVFTSTNPTKGWDGKIGNKVAKADVYQYMLRYTSIVTRKDVLKIGVVNLIR